MVELKEKEEHWKRVIPIPIQQKKNRIYNHVKFIKTYRIFISRFTGSTGTSFTYTLAVIFLNKKRQ
jgi:hypothetical protein